MEWTDPNTRKPRNFCLLVMDNMFKSFNVGLRFDLKGSIAQRTRLQKEELFDDRDRDITVSLKDNDFRKHMKQINFVECLKPDMGSLNEVLKKDSEFLCRNNLIDYSLLLGQLTTPVSELRQICAEDPSLGRGVYIDSDNRAWLVGIIDPLNGFETPKKFEYHFKKFGYGYSISCVPPEMYAHRFTSFMSDILKFEKASPLNNQLDHSYITTIAENEKVTLLPVSLRSKKTYADIVHPCPNGKLCIALNVLWPGVGTCYTAYYGPKGFDGICLTVGIIQNMLYNGFILCGFLTFFMGGLIPCLIGAFLVFAWVLTHSYFVNKMSSEKKKFGFTK